MGPPWEHFRCTKVLISHIEELSVFACFGLRLDKKKSKRKVCGLTEPLVFAACLLLRGCMSKLANPVHPLSSHPIPHATRLQWRGRDPGDDRLNALTLASGLDDYPRASHPSHNEEWHVDVLCWLALGCRVMDRCIVFVCRSGGKTRKRIAVLLENGTRSIALARLSNIALLYMINQRGRLAIRSSIGCWNNLEPCLSLGAALKLTLMVSVACWKNSSR